MFSNQIDDLLDNSISSADSKHLPKPSSIPLATHNSEKPNSIQSKFQNLDSEIIEMISGLKSNLIKDETARNEEAANSDVDDENLLLSNEPDEKITIEVSTTSDFGSASDSDVIPNGVPLQLTLKEEQQSNAIDQTNANKALADIYVDLNSIQPHEVHASRCIFEEKNGLKIILNFAKDKPRADVAVLVITTTNHNGLPMTNYHFDASVPKVCKQFFFI